MFPQPLIIYSPFPPQGFYGFCRLLSHTSSNCNNSKGKIKSKEEPWCWLVSCSFLSMLSSAPALVTAPFPTLTCSVPGWQLLCSGSTQQSREVRGTHRWEMIPGRHCWAPGAPLDTRAARNCPGLHPGTGSSAKGTGAVFPQLCTAAVAELEVFQTMYSIKMLPSMTLSL